MPAKNGVSREALSTQQSAFSKNKPYRGLTRMNADQKEKAFTAETRRTEFSPRRHGSCEKTREDALNGIDKE